MSCGSGHGNKRQEGAEEESGCILSSTELKVDEQDCCAHIWHEGMDLRWSQVDAGELQWDSHEGPHPSAEADIRTFYGSLQIQPTSLLKTDTFCAPITMPRIYLDCFYS